MHRKYYQCYQKLQIQIRPNTLKLKDPITNGELQSIQELTFESLDQLRDFMGCLGRGILENFCELPPPIEGGGGAPENKQLHVHAYQTYKVINISNLYQIALPFQMINQGLHL